MKKFLSIFIALAMVLSLFAGVGARSAKAASTLTVTPSGNFAGGLAGVGPAEVDAVGEITADINADGFYTVNVTTAGVGDYFAPAPNVSIEELVPTVSEAVYSVDAAWGTLGNQVITFSGTPAGLLVGDVVTVRGSTPGVGTILNFFNAEKTLAYVNVTTAVVEITSDLVGSVVSVRRTDSDTAYSTDVNWKTLGSQKIVITPTAGHDLTVGDVLTVGLEQLQEAVAATAFLTVGGTASAGDTSVTWQDTTGALHTATYTVVAGQNLVAAATGLKNAINAVVGGNISAEMLAGTSVIKLTQTVKGIAGNGKTLTASAVANALTIHTLGGLMQPAYIEVGKSVQLVAVNQTGAVVAATWTSMNENGSVIVGSTGLITGTALTGAAVISATFNGTTGTFVVLVILPQTITSLAVKLVPATPVVPGKQQFGAIAGNAAYSMLDYTTGAAWTEDLPVATLSATGLLTFSTAETGKVTATVGSMAATTTVTIDAAGVLTAKMVVPPVKRVILLTVGTDIVTVDGKATSVDAAPEIVGGRTFVPVRFIAETFGSKVEWLPETRGITITLGTTTIGLQIGNKTVVINGKIIALEAAPYIKNSRTMVPLRVISESFGGDVAWDPALRTITISYMLP